MGNANPPGWPYTARYGWNWRSARAVGGVLGSLTLPMPPWFRAVVTRCLLTRIALHADADGIRGSAGPPLAGVIEVIGWRRLGWLIGVAAAAAALAAAVGNLGVNGHAPIGVAVSALALVVLGWRAVAARRRRRRSAHPEAWLESGREDAEGSWRRRLRRGRLAAWTLRGLGRSTGR